MGLSGPTGRIGAPGLPGSQGARGEDGASIKGDRVSFFKVFFCFITIYWRDDEADVDKKEPVVILARLVLMRQPPSVVSHRESSQFPRANKSNAAIN